MWYYTALVTFGGVLAFSFIFVLGCFLIVFYSPRRRRLGEDEYPLPRGEVYKPYYDALKRWMAENRERDFVPLEIKSHDGLTLRARYYEYTREAPLEILFHGYRGTAERDLSGAVERCFALGRSALLVDQRAAGESDGHIITFGILEHRDALLWIKHAEEKFGKDKKIIIGGVSMGAATVLMAAGEELPENVISVLADCSYTSAPEIIKKVLRDIKLPVSIFYPVIKLGARIFGGFNIEDASPIESVKKCKKPLIIIHGDNDGFVPFSMGEELFAAAATEKKSFFRVRDAGHGLAYPKSPEEYVKAVGEFEKENVFIPN